MKKNDKIIVILGVFILVLSSIGIYLGVPDESKDSVDHIEDLELKGGSFKQLPSAVTVPDNNPFLPLIATPLAIHYDTDNTKTMLPLYVENFSTPSEGINDLRNEYLFDYRNNELILDETKTAEQHSIYLAETYWEKSDTALLIEPSQQGYQLGIAAAPIASYLSIPIIITDAIDGDVFNVFNSLGIDQTLVCGSNLTGYGTSLHFETIEEVINTQIEVVKNKFGIIDYITLTNPLDAYPPEILDSEIVLSESGTLQSGNLLPSQIINLIKSQFLGQTTSYKFSIPNDYKYALVKLDITNLEDPENIEKFGDNIMIRGSLTGYLRTYAHPAERDSNGDIIADKLHFETVMYDMGGEEFNIDLTSTYHTVDAADFEIMVTVEELSHPYYPMMKQFSSLSPYLTASHQGIIFAKEDFAFAPTDNITLNAKTLPGNTQVLYNPSLIPAVNRHVYENIHKPLNQLLATIKDITLSDSGESLQKQCSQSPVHICLLGDTIMLPHYYYRSPHSDPFDHAVAGNYGTNCPSDFIYGNIDPEPYSLLPYSKDHLENDLYSEFPEQENIVGRITGYDVQDASALIDRTLFYDQVIQDLDEWRETASVLTGAGTEVGRLPIFNMLQNLRGKTEPMKFPTGEKLFMMQRICETFEKGGFTAKSAARAQAQREGYSMEALREISHDGLLNRLVFPFWSAKIRQGYGNVEDLKNLSWWFNVIFGDSSDLVIGGELEQNSNLIISDSHAIWFEKTHGDILMSTIGVPFVYEFLARYFQEGRFRTPMDSIGSYTVRDVAAMDMGPSVMLVEGCGSGKIDGFIPQNSLANAYLHAGVNAYISPTTLSAFYGALEPRPDFQGGVGLGIRGYLKAKQEAKQGVYPPVYFNQYIFEELMLEMFDDNIDLGTALRNAKNAFLPAQFDIQFRWSPPLSLPSNLPNDLLDNIQPTAAGGKDIYPVEKYCTIYQINLLGDPAFNPYEPVNED
ncbi:MAG: C25 family cysteine peptidase [Thermoplasmatota archaeon]